MSSGQIDGYFNQETVDFILDNNLGTVHILEKRSDQSLSYYHCIIDFDLSAVSHVALDGIVLKKGPK